MHTEPWLLPFIEDIRGVAFADVGASHGVWSNWAHRRFAAVWAFEPDPKAFHVLEQTAKCNVYPRNQAVGSEVGQAILHTDGEQSSLLDEHPLGHTIYDECTWVDVVAFKDFTMDFDWIKIDVEGFEPDVIRGLKDNFANLIVECHDNSDAVVEALLEKGYLWEGSEVTVVKNPHPLAHPGHLWMIVEGRAGR